MTQFSSFEEYFGAVETLIARLRGTGQSEAARRLERGCRCINGLTDGYGEFLRAIEDVRSQRRGVLEGDAQEALDALRHATRRLVYRD